MIEIFDDLFVLPPLFEQAGKRRHGRRIEATGRFGGEVSESTGKRP